MFLAPRLLLVDVIRTLRGGGGIVSSTGLPGIVVPAGYTKNNLPVGIEFIGKSFDDLRLLQVAYGYEQATKKRKSPHTTPPLPQRGIRLLKSRAAVTRSSCIQAIFVHIPCLLNNLTIEYLVYLVMGCNEQSHWGVIRLRHCG
jgi:hypothetical protein